ncbi:MAG: peptide-methionine (S)-S-oxide reductase MsrA [Hyphomonas sp.]|uniref:peptide-methionine (S)-S-oxide reductase MsrA n=1 Tax=Hyphomonas sp. TaxID=87 RepID=UPI0017E0F395|nr:peptide-methionine (S)-S-oxide reductase MsrA [Hyphomonas sp.]MBU3921953.1 peptide-methionine (S)-S-oxide reductase MsrA [Alphaproteobacteria bacterium]MBA3070545.1 peptide-methionine (S)-S-oxide reductase MsrA [Hyphomonas sp.]MBU4062075.1 peptide-methionine (S)-S-oxide reductase MsrA [Alphaproteobacteria bacterium]MBU4165011.1 peptide-methionine (S)-S-oxide reductase MsrA [Alphaproteobacteria bacterium]MBU4568816.1 peptide-methionine (S)-S-oxide reductase MsrA [Alphaproteobacteria bacteriu
MFFARKPAALPTRETALPGRNQPIPTAAVHFVCARPLGAEAPAGFETAVFGLGCFWGAERIFWQTKGVWLTRVGYAGGFTPNPTYEEVCSGQTGHTEIVEVIFDPAQVSFAALVKLFLESHDPTQGMRQGNDIGTQYRSAIYWTTPAQEATTREMTAAYTTELAAAGRPSPVTTELGPRPHVFLAEDYHQQYLAKNPAGYCGIGGTGVSCPLPRRVG